MKFVDDFVAYAQEFTGCPEMFLRWSAVLALSAAAGDKHVHRRGDWDVRPNLWVLLLGNSSSYKSTGLATIRRILFEAMPGVIASQEYSYEKLIEDMALNPHRLFVYDEAESFFRMLDQSYNASMKSTLMTLWNRHPFRREIKGKEGKGEVSIIEGAYLCWGGASTSVQIANQLRNGSSDLLSGFLPRFLLVPYFGEETTIADPPPADRSKREALTARLKYLALSGERSYAYTPAALEAKKKWLAAFDKRMKGSDFLLGSFYKKMRDEHFHKLCILSAFERESTDMDVRDVVEASYLLWPIEKAWPDLLERLTEKEWDRGAKRVEAFLQEHHETDRTEVLNNVRGISAQKLTAILDGLSQDDKITIRISETGGRKKTTIHWLNGDH